jgi:hypothetical protein
MSSHRRRDYALIALLGLGTVLTFGAQNAAKGRTFAMPPPAALPLNYNGWKGTLIPESASTQAILPHARITTVQYEQSGQLPVAAVIVGSRDPNDMHTPERCFIGSGFELGTVERREVKVMQPEPKTWLFNLMTVKGNGVEEMILYGYDGVQMIGSSTIMARVMMKLQGPSKNPAYFVRLSTPMDNPQLAEKRLMDFAQRLMQDRAMWQNSPSASPKLAANATNPGQSGTGEQPSPASQSAGVKP